jgi:hypothetical protein
MFDHVPTVEYTLGMQFTMRGSDSPHGPQNGLFAVYLPFGGDLVMLWFRGSGGGSDNSLVLHRLSPTSDIPGGYTYLATPPDVEFNDFQPHWASVNVRPGGAIDVWIDDEYVLGWERDEGLPQLELSSHWPNYNPGVEALGFTNFHGEVLFDRVELAEIPEPSSLVILSSLFAVAGVVAWRRRHRR